MSFPSKIQAIGINKTGDFDVIEKLELPFPQPAPGNVLVKVCREVQLSRIQDTSCSTRGTPANPYVRV